jgi:anaerobic ribonucleoside-triphosphate reductase
MINKKVPAEVYSRVVGYFRPVNQWNKGKKQEFADRKETDVKNIKEILNNK